MFNTCDGYPRNSNILEMTTNEFNEKYKDYLEAGHYGLAISIPSVITYLDEKFKDLIQIPDFRYSQIKLKFNSSRFYCSPIGIETSDIEQEIDRLVKEYDLNM